jgi:hypothetical protein
MEVLVEQLDIKQVLLLDSQVEIKQKLLLMEQFNLEQERIQIKTLYSLEVIQ